MYDDIKDINVEEENIIIKLSQFELNYSTLDEFERTEDLFEELENIVKKADNIEDILEVLYENLYCNLEFDDRILLALSSKNPAQLQILSELRRIEKLGLSNKGLLNDFLSYSSFDNKFDELKKDDLVNFVPSDDSQTNAVLASFNNKLTVITGPPGSGKTQVITNILSNSILNGPDSSHKCNFIIKQ